MHNEMKTFHIETDIIVVSYSLFVTSYLRFID